MDRPAIVFVGSCLMIAGCDRPTDVPAPRTEVPEATALDGQSAALEKAQQLEKQIQQDAARQNQTNQINR